ncbi:chain length determinant protein tyrosine kinase EpsG [Glaciimonas immobilis]|uniref:Chain length determinant protein tyrosine kinase EpsG n=1 Tax=Glaciimonas immobilis TaxID=728004 RepID=A0A840RRM8_9BURK|nr:chain length determinant protein tyrosine kinase EpsG [Glaciimonas immobilis]KAF3998153.1 chain length determinant protein tyrosine kinase EpsG [Glaciimonas immobilis]MBB5199139.1 chain length determinant protein tyrosine kinase EpsG [Glaciimonas immobilis]
MNQPIASDLVSPFNPVRESSIGHLLLDIGKITFADVEEIVRKQKETGMRFGEAAQSLGLITEADIQLVLARQFDYSYLQPGLANFAPELVTIYQPFSEQAEILRTIRSQLMLRWFTGARKTLAIVSVNSGDGSSLFAANLAVVFSQLGEQTLLVDANLRTPRQHKIFNLSGKQGLSDILGGRADLDAIAEVDYFDKLSVLQAGTLPPNPQELISRRTFDAFNTSVSKLFDIVIYDVPTFSVGADALGIAAKAGGVLLLACKDRTRYADIKAAADQFSRIGVEVVGSVMVDF